MGFFFFFFLISKNGEKKSLKLKNKIPQIPQSFNLIFFIFLEKKIAKLRNFATKITLRFANWLKNK